MCRSSSLISTKSCGQGESGTPDLIRSAAREAGLTVTEVSLDAQFRCGGSRSYEDWVLRLLGLADGGPVVWAGDAYFEVQLASFALELEELLGFKAAEGYAARMTAGFCWPWNDPRPDGSLVDDVVIGDWKRPWNLRGDRSVGVRLRPACGPQIPQGSLRRAVSTRLRALSTTGTA